MMFGLTWSGSQHGPCRQKGALDKSTSNIGAEYLAKDLGLLAENAIVYQLGTAREITIHHTTTTLIADAASKDEIQLQSFLVVWPSSWLERQPSQSLRTGSCGSRMRRIQPLHPSRRVVLGSALTYVHLFIYVPVIKETIEDHDGCLDADIILKIAFMERHVSFSHFLTHPCTFLGAIAVSRDQKLYQTERQRTAEAAGFVRDVVCWWCSCCFSSIW